MWEIYNSQHTTAFDFISLDVVFWVFLHDFVLYSVHFKVVKIARPLL